MKERSCCLSIVVVVLVLVASGIWLRWHVVKVAEEDRAWAGYPLLHRHAALGRARFVRSQLEEGADVNELYRGRSALFYAVARGHKEIVQILIDHCADVDAGEVEPTLVRSRTPLQVAAAGDRHEMVMFLLEHGADVNRGVPLAFAAHDGNTAMMRRLFDSGADVNARTSEGWTALHAAARSGQLPAAEFLLTRGADVNARTKQGQTALSLAKTGGYQDLVALLVRYGVKE